MKDVGEDVAISSLHLFQGDMDLPPLSFHASLEKQWDEEEEPEEIETVLKVVPPSYHQYLDVFSKVKAEKLGVIYSLPKNESETLRACISENVENGFIRPSSSSTGAPVLFVNKKDGGLHLCVDYRKLNAVTRKNRYPVPSMNQLLTVFNGSTISSKIDLCGAYNLLRIKEGDEHLTAFRTIYGSYDYLVMPFGLTNAPAFFQNLVNDIFADFLDIFFVVYLIDIMVFSSSEEEHVKHVASVLQRLRDNTLFAKASKCVFHASSVEHLVHFVSIEGLKMDSSKVQQILNWPQPKNIKALQSFPGFSNFYRCFIKNYSKKLSALTSLLKKVSPFIFNEKALSHFQILKEAFTTAPIVSHFNPSLPNIIETDASDYALGAVLSQVNDSGKHPIAFDSCKLLPEFLSEFHFSITHHPGRLATLPDDLSFHDNVYPERGVDFISKNTQNLHQVLKQNEIKESRFFSIKVEVLSDLVDQIQKAVWQDKDYKEILKQLARGESVSDYTLEPQAKLLLFKDRVVIPSNHELQLDILQKRHDSPLAGHPGQGMTHNLMKRDLYWAGINQIIKDYVSSCQQCSRNKNIHPKKFGLLKPLQIPYGPWNSLSMDFITQLALSRNFDSILVVVDRFSKMAIIIPAYSKITALDLAQIFISHVFSKHGLPISI
ncbi:hypothetical protein O181_099509, partial [Austropuccinia psidii MF-1]|nr:hypothetical protein [Austropuccinia psidii MF-1]